MGLIIGSRMTVAQPRSEKPAVGHSEQIQTVHDDNSPEKCRMYVQTARRRPPTGFDEHGHTVHGRERFSNAPRQDPSRKVVDHRVQVHAGSVEQANNGGVDVPHLVGARRSKADRRLRRVHAEPGAAPVELAHETVPSRRRGPDLAEPLRQDGERAGRDVPVFGRGHHVLDRPDFGWGESMGRPERTGRLVVKRTRVLQPLPGMEPTRRHAQEPQERPHRHKRSGPIHGEQDPDLGASVWQTLVRQCESGASEQGEGEPKECGELLHASSELYDFLLEFRCPEVRRVQGHHDVWGLAEPPTGGRARNPEIGGDGHVPGALDEIPKPVVGRLD